MVDFYSDSSKRLIELINQKSQTVYVSPRSKKLPSTLKAEEVYRSREKGGLVKC